LLVVILLGGGDAGLLRRQARTTGVGEPLAFRSLRALGQIPLITVPEEQFNASYSLQISPASGKLGDPVVVRYTAESVQHTWIGFFVHGSQTTALFAPVAEASGTMTFATTTLDVGEYSVYLVQHGYVQAAATYVVTGDGLKKRSTTTTTTTSTGKTTTTTTSSSGNTMTVTSTSGTSGTSTNSGTSSGTSGSTSAPFDGPNPKLSGGAVAGIVIGVVLGVAAALSAALFFFRARIRYSFGINQGERAPIIGRRELP